MKIVVIGAALLALSGCNTTGMSRMNTYSFPVHKVVMPDDTYRVYAHKTDNSLAVSPSLGKIATVGATQGATLGLVNTMTPEQRLEAAAQKYLVDNGKANCRITRNNPLNKPMHEFWYECT